jgi:DNA polymerase elongation subunit (family B)
MTPKEKGIELVKKFRIYAFTSDYDYFAENCALIAVDEIIKALNDDIYIQGETDIDSHIKYWDEVKNEIEKL